MHVYGMMNGGLSRRQFELRMVLTIPEMHQHLDSLNSFFAQKTSTFISVINSHPGRLTAQDLTQFADLIEDIRAEALARISEYFNTKLATKCDIYDSEITAFTESGNEVEEQLATFREQLEGATVEMKKEQNRREKLLDSFSQKYSERRIIKQVWKRFQENRRERLEAKELDRKMDEVYRRNLLKKAFFPWRTLTYKEGYENTVRRETEKDIQSIHEQYHSIIDILKAKIVESDELVKVKRAAKGEFAFALSKNLLKSISNLSLEVMSLNQMSLRDGEADEHETRKFMKSVENVIGDKLARVREYKGALSGAPEGEAAEDKKRRKKITFA